MKNAIKISFALTAMAFMVGTAFADNTGLALAKQKECLSCHDVDKETLAPSFKSIAKKYKGQTGFDGRLISQILSGSSSTMGAPTLFGGGLYHLGGVSKMPNQGPRAKVSVAEANKLLDWILSLE